MNNCRYCECLCVCVLVLVTQTRTVNCQLRLVWILFIILQFIGVIYATHWLSKYTCHARVSSSFTCSFRCTLWPTIKNVIKTARPRTRDHKITKKLQQRINAKSTINTINATSITPLPAPARAPLIRTIVFSFCAPIHLKMSYTNAPATAATTVQTQSRMP